MPLLLLSKSQPLRWVVIWFGQILWITASILFGLRMSEQALYRLLRLFLQKSERTHAAAPPFQITTAALGCDLVWANKV